MGDQIFFSDLTQFLYCHFLQQEVSQGCKYRVSQNRPQFGITAKDRTLSSCSVHETANSVTTLLFG